MRKVGIVFAIICGAALASCGPNPFPSAPRTLTPKPPAFDTSFQKIRIQDLSCQSGYVVAYDENGNAYCEPVPVGDAAAEVVAPVFALYTPERVVWHSLDQRYSSIPVYTGAIGALLTANARDASGHLVTHNVTADDLGKLWDNGNGVVVTADVDSAWRHDWLARSSANPAWTPLHIQLDMGVVILK